jgi:uncharacterized membrane protein YphA (DoxX/SURF4 family)
MKSKVTLAARILLGLIFFVLGGLNGFFQFLPMPTPPPEAGAFFGALMATGYFLPFLKITELVVGALLLANLFVPLVLTVLAPIVVNIVLFHLFLDPAGSALAIIILALEIYLAYSYRDSYKGVLARKAEPSIESSVQTAHAV